MFIIKLLLSIYAIYNVLIIAVGICVTGFIGYMEKKGESVFNSKSLSKITDNNKDLGKLKTHLLLIKKEGIMKMFIALSKCLIKAIIAIVIMNLL